MRNRLEFVILIGVLIATDSALAVHRIRSLNAGHAVGIVITIIHRLAGRVGYRNAYTYENDRIKTVAHNTTGDTPDVTYTFNYDELGRKTTVKVGSQTLSTNVYASDRSGLLKEVQYGNDGKVKYAYDEYDRLTGVRYDDETTDRYTYEYGADGEASVVRDNNLGRVLQTERDLTQRAMGTQLRDTNGNLLYRTELDYDTQNRLVGFGETASGRNYKTAYTYDNDNRVTGMTFDGGNAIGYTYDNLGRIATRTASPLSTTYGYVAGGYGTGSTTPLVASIQQTGIPFSYAYDSRGNIISETRNGKTTSYAYDALGQLIRVNDPHLNQTWVFNYDRGGNILNKVRYAYTTGTLGTALETIPYTYGDANWKDKLTAYNGKSITYDAIGNPLNDGTWTYEWQAGRQLKRMSAEGTALTFQYDHNGLRTQKVVEADWYPETTNYYLHGKLLTHMTVDYRDTSEAAHQDVMHFFYDAQSRPAKVSYNGTIYTYVHNLQGDVVGLLDNSGTLVVEYKYDAWGKAISTTGSLAATLGKRNPFRYRGYIYDEETGLYYLRSRYYNAVSQRFLSPDNFIAEGQALLCHNPYCYCANAPIAAFDPNGTWFLTALAAGASAIVKSAISAAATAVVSAVAPIAIGVVAVAAAVGLAVLCVSAIKTTIETVEKCHSVATSIVKAVESVEEISKEDTYGNSIYVLHDDNNVVHYVGITNNVARRAREHLTDPHHPQRANYKMKVVATGLSRPAARIGEQVLISAYTMDALENARREIAVRNLPKFSKELRRIAELWKVDEIPIRMLY